MREIDHLARLFGHVTHIAPLYPSPPPASAIPYQASNVTLHPVPPAGGPHLRDKFGVLLRVPAYVQAISAELRAADVVHVRCPANISLLAIVLLALARHPDVRWVKYAGNWQPDRREAWTYGLQRWLLRMNWHRGVVTVNGAWPDQPGHVHSFLNPCLSERELTEASHLSADKELTSPLRLLYAGRLEASKGVFTLLQVVAQLQEEGINATCDVVGGGPQQETLEKLAADLGIARLVRFWGWLPRVALSPLYAKAHLVVHPSYSSEGWPKVLSEGMAYGAVPVASQVSSIPQLLKQFGVGRTLAPQDVEGFAGAIMWYTSHPDVWRAESASCRRAARVFSYEAYLQAVEGVLGL